MSAAAAEVETAVAVDAVEAARAAEFWQTPTEAVEALLLGDGPELPGGIWLDPCAGLGRIPRAVSRHRPDVLWLLCELLPGFRPALDALDIPLVDADIGDSAIVTEDFLADPAPHSPRAAWPRADVVIFNSPFTLTRRFVVQAWRHGRWVVSLQRQSWIGPARGPWLREHMPDRYILPRRPSFRGDGKTDGCEYEWHAWPPDRANPAGRRRDGITRMLRPGREQMELRL